MADFCKQCSIKNFNEDFRNLHNLGGERVLPEGMGWPVVCEGCGPTYVNDEGECISKHCLEEHAEKKEEA